MSFSIDLFVGVGTKKICLVLYRLIQNQADLLQGMCLLKAQT